MNKPYYEYLPKDYFHGLYEKTKKYLERGNNVLISAMYGCGGNTFIQMCKKFISDEAIFDEIHYYDPEIENFSPYEFCTKLDTTGNKKHLIIIRLIEKLPNIKEELEKLSNLKHKNYAGFVFLVLTNEESVIHPERYTAESSVFFSEHFYIPPFDSELSEIMIRATNKYYGWNVDPNVFPKIYTLCGGIARLMKHSLKEISERSADPNDPNDFLKTPPVNFELNYLTKILLKASPVDLKQLGLVNENNEIISTLLKTYFLNYRSELVKEILPKLSRLETQIVTYIYEQEGQIVSLEKIGVLMGMTDQSYSLAAIYKLISRLKPKIKKYFKLENIKGKGYLLTRTF